MRSTLSLWHDMMDVQVTRRSAAGHRAAVMIAREHLLAQPRRHRGRRALGRRGVERAQDLGVARCALEDFGRNLDLSPGAVLRRAPAVRALLIRDLMRRTCGARTRRDRPAAQ